MAGSPRSAGCTPNCPPSRRRSVPMNRATTACCWRPLPRSSPPSTGSAPAGRGSHRHPARHQHLGIAEAEVAVAAMHSGQPLPAGLTTASRELGSPSEFLARHLGLTGPAYTLSTACSSSACAFISAQRLLMSGLADAVIVGGGQPVRADPQRLRQPGVSEPRVLSPLPRAAGHQHRGGPPSSC